MMWGWAMSNERTRAYAEARRRCGEETQMNQEEKGGTWAVTYSSSVFGHLCPKC